MKLEGGREVLPAEEDHRCRDPCDGAPRPDTPIHLQVRDLQRQGQGDEEAARLMEDAMDLQEAGCFSIVFEKIPAKLAAEVSSSLTIPTIGIGAGVDCDGQVLVLHDMLGITQEFSPRFLRRYADLENTIDAAITGYISDVRAKSFPSR